MNHFNKIQYRLSALILSVMLVLTACSGKSTPWQPASGAPSGDIVLTVAVHANEPFFDQLKQKFEAAHPNIKVEFKVYVALPSDKSASGAASQIQRDMEKFTSTVTTELASGNAPDLLVTNYLPYKKFADKKLLADLGEMMRNDPAFKQDDFFTNVFDALKYQGTYYTLPTSVQFTNLWVGDRSVLGDAKLGDDTWSWAQFIERITPVVPQGGSALEQMSPSPEDLLCTMLNPGVEKFVDHEAKTASFDSKEFTDLLDQAKQMVEQGLVTGLVTTEGGKNLNIFTPFGFRSLSDFFVMPEMMAADHGGIYKSPSITSGQGYAFRSNLTLSINNQSPNKQAAWEFMKFVLSEEIQNDSSSTGMRGIPVNKAAFHKLQGELKQLGTVGKDGKPLADGQQSNIQPPTEEQIQGLEKYMTGITTMQETDGKITGLIRSEVEPFFKGQKSADDTAKAIQQKVFTYLNE